MDKYILFSPSDNSFTKASETGLWNLGGQGDMHLFDVDNDHHLDVLMNGFDWADEDMPSLTKLFKNLDVEENQKPQPPSELNLDINGSTLQFSWDGASDDKTSENSLQYELKVGTTSGGQEIAKYVITTKEWFLDLEEIPENLFWSVKSIDASKVFSDPSEEGQLSNFDFSDSSIKIYPNPSSEFVHINSNKRILKIELYSILGDKLNVKFEDGVLDVSLLSPNVYVLYIQLEGNETISKKLIVK